MENEGSFEKDPFHSWLMMHVVRKGGAGLRGEIM